MEFFESHRKLARRFGTILSPHARPECQRVEDHEWKCDHFVDPCNSQAVSIHRREPDPKALLLPQIVPIQPFRQPSRGRRVEARWGCRSNLADRRISVALPGEART